MSAVTYKQGPTSALAPSLTLAAIEHRRRAIAMGFGGSVKLAPKPAAEASSKGGQTTAPSELKTRCPVCGKINCPYWY